jgi:hypothetical protein
MPTSSDRAARRKPARDWLLKDQAQAAQLPFLVRTKIALFGEKFTEQAGQFHPGPRQLQVRSRRRSSQIGYSIIATWWQCAYRRPARPDWTKRHRSPKVAALYRPTGAILSYEAHSYSDRSEPGNSSMVSVPAWERKAVAPPSPAPQRGRKRLLPERLEVHLPGTTQA